MSTTYTPMSWRVIHNRRTSLLHATAAATVLMALGGSSATAVAAEHIMRLGTGSAHQIAPTGANMAPVAGVRVELLAIRDSLRLSIAELAQLFGVSRPTIYSWQDGKPPAEANAARVISIARALEPHMALLQAQSGRIAHRAIEGRTTLLQMLTSAADPQHAVYLLVGVLNREAAQRERLNARLRDRRGERGDPDLDAMS